MDTERTKIERIRNDILRKVTEYCTTQEEEYRSQASAPTAITVLLYDYVFDYDRRLYAWRIKQATRSEKLPDLNQFNVEFMETAESVLQSFSPEMGDFFAYFDTAFIRNVIQARGKALSGEKHGGMIIPYGKKMKTIAAIIREYSRYIEPQEVVLIAERDYGVSVTEEDVNVYKSGVARLNGTIETEEGETELLDFVADSKSVNPETETPYEDRCKAVFCYVEDAFLRTQERQREYLSAVLTIRFSKWIFNNPRLLMPLAQNTTWFVPSVYQVYERTGKEMEQKEIAERLGMSEGSISRAYGRFLDNYMDIADLEELLEIIKRD